MVLFQTKNTMITKLLYSMTNRVFYRFLAFL
jgi:hypothetical protein